MAQIGRKKVVLITGCDTGFGHMLAMKLHRLEGFYVLASCLTERGRSQYKKLSNISSILLDVTKADSIETCFQTVTKLCADYGLYGLVNNAGVAEFAPFEWTTEQSFRRVMEINFFGMVAVTRAALPFLRKYNGNSRIVNVASVAGLFSTANSTSYSCSKYAVEAFSDGLRREMLAFTNVSVHCIEPGYFSTNILKEKDLLVQFKEAWDRSNDEVKSYYTSLDDFSKKSLDYVGNMKSTRVDKVVDAMCTALTSKFPKRRYTVGWDANLLWKPLSFLPGWLQDVILFFIPLYFGIRFNIENKHRENYGVDPRIIYTCGGGLVAVIFLMLCGFSGVLLCTMYLAIVGIVVTWIC